MSTSAHPAIDVAEAPVDAILGLRDAYRREMNLVQELKRICYEMGRIPATRCHQDNHASRQTLQCAGMFPCARIVGGRIAV